VNGQRSGFRPDVQGLRAVAVIAVIADHLAHWPTGGFVGVDVFFVISGYLITGLLLREHARTGTISFRNFYLRRVKRIIPASVLVLASTVAVAYPLLDADRFHRLTTDVGAALVFVANWRFAAEGTDYFQEGLPPSAVQHFWSLAVEEQFYVVWPWLMLGLLLLLRRNARLARTAAGVAIGVITVASLAWALWETAHSPAMAYFSTFSRAWELGIGALIAVLGNTLAIRSAAWRTTLAWIGLGGIAVSLFVVPQSPGFPAPWALLPVLATALVLAAGAGGEQRHLWPLTNRVSTYVGDISYSLYLWHFPVIVLLATVLPTDGPAYYAVAAALILGLSVLGYHGVEDPLRRMSWRRPRAGSYRPVLVMAVILLGLTVPVAVFAPGRDSTPAEATPSTVDNRCLGAAVRDTATGCAPVQGDFVLPAVADLANDTAGAFDCWIAESQPMKTCTFGTGGTSVALLGDSHAAMLLPGLQTQLPAYDWTLDSYVGWGCQWMRTGTGSTCDATMHDIQQRLETGPRYDIVIVTAARHKTATEKDWVSDMYAAAWRPVAARGTKIIVVADNPGVPQKTLDCVRRVTFSVLDNDCGTPVAEAYKETDAMLRAATLVPGVEVVDLRSHFCDDTVCPAVIGNVITYRDTVGHLTGTYSRTLGPYLAAAVSTAAAG
jgi:peptidoglycan/LPS O-acetylase OafA/YrhL